MAIDESHTARVDARGRGIDPLAEQAATLLAKAMVTSRDRDALWERFQSLVAEEVREMEEAPILEALEAMERQGIRLEAVARVVNDRIGG
jgi:TPP-dependent pyruvate/acetoin dehydrogenase alpha subunit